MTKVEAIKKVLINNGGLANWDTIYDEIKNYYINIDNADDWKAGVRGVLYREIRNNRNFKKVGDSTFALIHYNIASVGKKIKKPKLNKKQELIIYQPQKTINEENLNENTKEIDYIENHRKLIEIGKLAEKIVLKSEIDFLNLDFPELAKKVQMVSNNSKLRFDILSFETDGKQKQIEVKAISVNNNTKSFIITRNEFFKSKTYSNYYIYCVTEINSDNPKILRIKNPDFKNNDNFLIEPLAYKITFE